MVHASNMEITYNTKDCADFVRSAYIKGYSSGKIKSRDDKEPNWFHCARVADTLEILLGKYNEGSQEERQAIVLGAIGHDLLEDVEVSEQEIQGLFGELALQHIKGMTRKGQDFNTKDYHAYSQKLAGSSEEVRLIKLSDLYDNYASPIYRLLNMVVQDVTDAKQKKHTEEYNNTRLKFLKTILGPILDVQFEAVKKTVFSKYPKIAQDLISKVEDAQMLYGRELERKANDNLYSTLLFAVK